MVHRAIFLGISAGITAEKQALSVSITINDGFFVLGIKNYTFPIIIREDDPGSSPGGSPQLKMEEEENDSEFDEIKGMYIDLKKKIVLNKRSEAEGPRNALEKIINPETYARIQCHFDKNGEQSCIVKEKIISKLPPDIEKECLKDNVESINGHISFEYFSEETLDVINNTLIVVLDKWIGEYSKGNAIKIVGAGVSTNTLLILDFGDKIKTLLWRKYDILPCFFSGDAKPLDQQSESFARKCAGLFGYENIPRLSIGKSNEVKVDGGHIWFSSLEEYKKEIGKNGHLFMKDLASEARGIVHEKISYFSSTPQGGGVSLMRHSLMRFFRMAGVDASWYVCVPSPSVFAITKQKIHNILQGVAPEGAELKEEDKSKIDQWLKMNYVVNWKKVVENSTIIVLDDHQVARLVPLIKRDNPSAKIIYRSHIQILTENLQKSEQMRNVWGFLWETLRYVDYFVSHPIESAAPADVPREKIVFQPAGTDPIDGLNKPLPEAVDKYYQSVFNRICIDNGEMPLNFSSPYITQIARFDPSKGISDLLEAYYKLYQIYLKSGKEKEFSVGLVLCGHGSVDDPEGSVMFEKISAIVQEEKFAHLKHLITKVRLPPSDQLLNVVLRNAYICCQLSVCEGYEVKVTESLMKKVPVIVYDVGGLPLQVKHEVNGYVVEKRNTDKVAEHMYNLLYDKSLYKKIVSGIEIKECARIYTPFQAFFWVRLFSQAVSSEKKRESVRDIGKEIAEKYLDRDL